MTTISETDAQACLKIVTDWIAQTAGPGWHPVLYPPGFHADGWTIALEGLTGICDEWPWKISQDERVSWPVGMRVEAGAHWYLCLVAVNVPRETLTGDVKEAESVSSLPDLITSAEPSFCPQALAQQDGDDDRPGVQEVTRDMIFRYVYRPDGDCELHRYESAYAFADWAHANWWEFHNGGSDTTNGDVIEGMLTDWRGNV